MQAESTGPSRNGSPARAGTIESRLAGLSPRERTLVEELLKQRVETVAKPSGIPIRRDRATAPLSFAQQRLWFLDQLSPGNPFYNEVTTTRVLYDVNTDVARQAVQEIVRRHDILRTNFRSAGGQPVQVVAPETVAPELVAPFTLNDLRSIAEEDREAEAGRLAAEEARQPFDLSNGPLIRVRMFRLGEQDYLFLLNMHHIICDGWSIGLFFIEFNALYEAYARGEWMSLPDLPLQYGDYAAWQREAVKSGSWLDGQLAYWKRQLADLPALDLRTDRPRPPVQTFRGAQLHQLIPSEVARQLKTLSHREGVTLFMVLIAAFKVLLHRYTGQDDIAVGSYIAGRGRAELENLIGLFVNTVVLRTSVDGDPVFRQLLKRVQQVALQAYTNQDVPFDMLVEQLQPERDLGRNPLFQVVFQLQNSPPTAASQDDGAPPYFHVTRQTAIFDLAFDLSECGDGIQMDIEYSTELFDEETVRRMAAHYQCLLASIVRHPDRRISELNYLSSEELRPALRPLTETASPYPRDACLHGLYEEQVERTPDGIALIEAGRQAAYQDLNRSANQLAHHLLSLGVRAEEPVGVFLQRSIDAVACLLAVLKAGAAYVPLDPAYPRSRLAFMVKNAGVRYVLTARPFEDSLGTIAPDCMSIDVNAVMTSAGDRSNPETTASANSRAYVIYSSGSTGKPKGVLGLHRGMVN
ncbi:MAG: condensation domain-containing protein, partial [Bryobacteraceae bacterium]